MVDYYRFTRHRWIHSADRLERLESKDFTVPTGFLKTIASLWFTIFGWGKNKKLAALRHEVKSKHAYGLNKDDHNQVTQYLKDFPNNLVTYTDEKDNVYNGKIRMDRMRGENYNTQRMLLKNYGLPSFVKNDIDKINEALELKKRIETCLAEKSEIEPSLIAAIGKRIDLLLTGSEEQKQASALMNELNLEPQHEDLAKLQSILNAQSLMNIVTPILALPSHPHFNQYATERVKWLGKQNVAKMAQDVAEFGQLDISRCINHSQDPFTEFVTNVIPGYTDQIKTDIIHINAALKTKKPERFENVSTTVMTNLSELIHSNRITWMKDLQKFKQLGNRQQSFAENEWTFFGRLSRSINDHYNTNLYRSSLNQKRYLECLYNAILPLTQISW
jgi:hypothetical protein